MTYKRWLLTSCLLLLVGGIAQAKSPKASAESSDSPKTESDFMMFFFRIGQWIDNYSLKDVDTAYITLPEHPWRIALTNSEIGIHSTIFIYSIIL